ncbi:MAG: phospholipid carrier-dependent glycosyltransferase [Anaerolineae bacterium]|nr:phospholipid carrier-dependent glycosyltransferase [Anaerolineae bacterium]
MSHEYFIFFAGAITLLGFLARVIGLHDIPPGLHYDEASAGLFVRAVAFDGYRPIFITAYTGHETLWYYLAAPIMRIMGSGIFPLRLASVFIGTATVAVTAWMARQLYPDDANRSWLALLTAAIMALSFWHAILSRTAFRAISEPLMQGLSIGFLWLALARQGRSRRWWLWMMLAGVFTGLAGHTYLAARLFPIPLVLALLVFLLTSPDRGRRIPGMMIFGISAAVVISPLVWFFAQHPEAFATRIDQVAPRSLAEALTGWWQALGVFFVRGDPIMRFNLPLRPMYGWLLGICFVLGLLVVIWDTFTARDALGRARGALLLAWPLAMLAPTALATAESFVPSHLRAVGLAPVVALYPALGIVGLARLLGTLRRQALPRRLAGVVTPAATILIVLLNGTLTLDAIRRWGMEPLLYYENDGPTAAMALYLNRSDLPPATAYAATEHLQHPTLAFLSDRDTNVHSLAGGRTIVLAPEGDTLMLYTRSARPHDDWFPLIQNRLISAPPGPDGTPDFRAFLFPSNFSLDLRPIEPANFGNVIRLESASIHPVASGGVANIDLGWRITGVADQPDYAFTASLCDEWGFCWLLANLDGTLVRAVNRDYPSLAWKPGERLITRMEVPLPAGLPPSHNYRIQVNVFSAAANRTLPALDAAGGFAGTFAEVGPVVVTRNTFPRLETLPIQYRLEVPALRTVSLLGYDLPERLLRPGEHLRLALHWLSIGAQPDDATVRLLLNESIVLYAGDPVHGTYPLTQWAVGEAITDRYDERLPVDLEPGQYRLSVQLGDGTPVVLDTLTIEPSNRLFEIPGDVRTTGMPVVFGGQVALAGFTLPVRDVHPGESVTVGLVWRSEARSETSYTVFVHLIDASGQIVAQLDRTPAVGNQPYDTDLWLPGEVIVDDGYVLSLPDDLAPGEYRVRVGLYLPENGQRLSVPDTTDNAVILPGVIRVR